MGAEVSAEAVVLRRSDTGEADRRLVLLTREFGKIDVVAKGARKARSRFTGASEPLSRALFTWAEGKVRRFVTQVQPLTSFPGIRSDYDKALAAMALVELVSVGVPYESPHEEASDMFELVVQSLEALELSLDWIPVLVWAEVRLLESEGVHPEWTSCAVTGAAMSVNPSWVSPTAGGLVDAMVADRFSDRFLVSSEALIGLRKTSLLERPPSSLKRADECLRTVFAFWRHTLEHRLPANEAVVQGLP